MLQDGLVFDHRWPMISIPRLRLLRGRGATIYPTDHLGFPPAHRPLAQLDGTGELAHFYLSVQIGPAQAGGPQDLGKPQQAMAFHTHGLLLSVEFPGYLIHDTGETIRHFPLARVASPIWPPLFNPPDSQIRIQGA